MLRILPLLLWFAIVRFVYSFSDWYLIVLGYDIAGLGGLFSILDLSYVALAVTQLLVGVLIDVVGEISILITSSMLFLASCIALACRSVEVAIMLYLLTCELNVALTVLLSKIAPAQIGFNVSLLELVEHVSAVAGPALCALVLELQGFSTLALLCIVLNSISTALMLTVRCMYRHVVATGSAYMVKRLGARARHVVTELRGRVDWRVLLDTPLSSS